jgi:polyhydroxyalkanoate synthase subunit PhaC
LRLAAQTEKTKETGLNNAPQLAWDAWVRDAHTKSAAAVREWVKSAEVDDLTRAKLDFAAEQWVAASDPANFLATNPDALKRALETKGQSLMDGMRILASDVARGHVANTDEAAFEVGQDLAVTPGAVVMRNELVELIQYSPSTPKVGGRPFLMVPPCINKFYILDLQPDNSFVRYIVSQGHTVFMVSWRNPTAEQGHLGWDDYLSLGVVEPIRAVQKITGSKTLNALGFCVGGTILATALAALAEKGEKPVASLTLLTTLLDFGDVGQLGIFVDPATVSLREATLKHGGVLGGKDLATTFSFLRPRDLVWNYVARGYLMGEAPPAFDLLYWNSDSTNLPGPMYCWYLRNMYLENNLRKAGRVTSLGVPVDLSRLQMPVYIVASREDHIVPWKTAYESTSLVGGDVRFTLGASGHIAGVINPAHKNKRSHWVGDVNAGRGSKAKRRSADAWFDAATEVPGSWWGDWAQWLQGHAGSQVAARKTLGGQGFKPLEAAPGSYVKTKI